jgi:di/tricarboxylate transporter
MSGQGFDESFQRQLGTQSWILYGIGMFLILLRTSVVFVYLTYEISGLTSSTDTHDIEEREASVILQSMTG